MSLVQVLTVGDGNDSVKTLAAIVFKNTLLNITN
jgi:hypothetical protein